MNLECGCHLFMVCACSNQFPKEHYMDVRSLCAELDQEALDFVIMGAMMTNTTIAYSKNCHGHIHRNKQRVSTLYHHQLRTTSMEKYRG